MLRFRSATLIVLLLVLAWPAGAIEVSQTVSADHASYEDTIRFEIKVQWPGTPTDYLFDQPINPQFEGLRMGSLSSSVTSQGTGTGELTVKAYHFELLPTKPGLARIEPLTISYLKWPDSLPGQLVTEDMSVMVAQPIAPVKKGGGLPLWVWIAAPALVVVCGAGAGVWWWRGRHRQPTEPVLTPRDAFLQGLVEARKRAGNDLKQFQSELCGMMSHFLHDRYNIDVSGKDQAELTTALAAAGLPQQSAEQIAGWYHTALRDKFRPVTAGPGETIRLESDIRALFEQIPDRR